MRKRVVMAMVKGGLSRNKAAARFGIAISTANIWVRRYLATKSFDHGKIRGYKPAKLSAPHADWLRARCAKGGFTLRRLVAELASERGIKVDYVSVWRFVRAEKLTYKKSPARQ